MIPKSSNSAQNMQISVKTREINKEFCGFLSKPPNAKQLIPFSGGFKKITGNEQGSSIATPTFFLSLLSEAPSFSNHLLDFDESRYNFRNRTMRMSFRVLPLFCCCQPMRLDC